MLSEFSREQRELPWQPNLGKNKPKLHLFQFRTRYRDTFCVQDVVFGVGEFKYAIRIFKGAKGVAMATKFGQK